MTPAAILALLRDTALVVGVGLILWLVYRGGENSVKASDLKSLQAEIAQQAKILNQWHQESTDANDQLSRDVAAIHAAPVVVHDWMRNDTCPKPPVLPATSAAASGQPASAGGSQQGPGDAARADRRDAIVADFKQRWETSLAECRAALAQWPRP